MERTINAKQLRQELSDVVRRVQRGERFTVLYRSRPAFRIVGMEGTHTAVTPLAEDPIYQAPALGRTKDGLTSRDHDAILYKVR